MSSYLNFYLVPKKEGSKPEHFISYCRNSDVYQRYYEEVVPVFIGNGEEYNYSELPPETARKPVNAAKEELEKVKKDFKTRVEAFKQLTNLTSELVNDYVNEYTSTKKFIEELEEEIIELQSICDWVSEIRYSSDFEKVLVNID